MGTTRYKNTDLVIDADFDLTRLTRVLESRGLWASAFSFQTDGTWCAVLETDDTFATPEASLAPILEVIETLEGEAAKSWNQCTRRAFDLGYYCGDSPFDFTSEISNQTLARMVGAVADLRITMYRYEAPTSTPEDLE